MANDIVKANDSNDIKHYTIVSKTPGRASTGYVTKDDYVIRKPVIADIEDKYDARFKAS